MSELELQQIQTQIAARSTQAAGVFDRFAMRALDIGVASVLLALLLPVFVLIAIAIKLESRGGIFYRARRLGRGGRVLFVLKFRKMREDAAGAPLTVAGDDRFTRVGLLLTRYKLDELPQLWNVLKGEMSLVGPRPEDEAFIALHPVEFVEILSLRPGITGLSQLAFAKENDLLAENEPHEFYVNSSCRQRSGSTVSIAATVRDAQPQDSHLDCVGGAAQARRRRSSRDRDGDAPQASTGPGSARTRAAAA